MPQTPSTRWCPTAEQLMILEAMYRNGIRTPSAPQIQQITAYLSLYGKIEGKNVFYWFQNHKAREREKLHRRLGRQHQVDLLPRSEGSSTTPVLQLNNQTPQASFPNYQGHVQLELEASDQALQEEEEPSYNYTPTGSSCLAARTGCFKPPLKTLDLFPTTSTGMKDR
ncbi:uncharacterized protein LOC141814160 [Curcuma longa]|uniref:uncharacterized protein LOC141814160 n=1 Tax=Curcuma longa TaxID=136217 RepID=UPI003D9EA15F